MVAGAVIVAALVIWALTRTVEPTPSTSAAASATTPAAGELPAVSPTPSDTATAATASAPAAPPAVQGDRSEVKRIAVEDARAKFNRGEVTVIDVRDDASFASGHIPGALHMPFASIESMSDSLPKDKPIITYCT